MAAAIYTIPPIIWVLNELADLKDTGREFHVELPQKESDDNPNLHVLVGDKIRFLPDLKV